MALDSVKAARPSSTFLETRQGRRAQARTSPEARDFMRSMDGWRIVSGGDRCGLTAHRGVLHPTEYVSMALLVPAVERRLGFTIDELRSVYCQGRKSDAQRELRARIDARLLEIRRSGGNLEILARIVGVDRRVIGKALARAKTAVASLTSAPAVSVPQSSVSLVMPYLSSKCAAISSNTSSGTGL